MFEIRNVSRETQEKISIYKLLLAEWNPKINLVSPSSLCDFDSRHIVDGLALSQYISSKELSDKSFIDVGSGNGIPGVVLALNNISNVILVESDVRKCSFLRCVKHELGLSFDIVCDRIEKLSLHKEQIIVSRGFASIKKTADVVSREIYTPRMILLKGKRYPDELLELSNSYGYVYLGTKYQGDRIIIDVQVEKRKR